jgi:hypothetical protein
MAITGATGTATISAGMSGPLFFPVLFLKALTFTLAIAAIILIIATIVSESVPLRDIVGTILSAGIVAYIVHLWFAQRK